MPCCVLSVRGEAFDPTDILPTLTLKPYSVFRKGERFSPESKKINRWGGFSCDVSDAGGNLTAQAEEAIRFLKRYHEDLVRLNAVGTIESKSLDFGHYIRLSDDEFVFQFDFLPVELLRLCGELGIGIELSLYPPPRGNS